MNIKEICKNLCIKDQRNPDFEKWLYDDFEEPYPKPRINCYCDNCFYGRDKLAVELLKLK